MKQLCVCPQTSLIHIFFVLGKHLPRHFQDTSDEICTVKDIDFYCMNNQKKDNRRATENLELQEQIQIKNMKIIFKNWKKNHDREEMVCLLAETCILWATLNYKNFNFMQKSRTIWVATFDHHRIS